MIAALLLLAAGADPAPMRAITPDDLIVLARFSRCVAVQAPRASATAIDGEGGLPELDKRLNFLAQNHANCLDGGKLRVRGILLAGAIAEGLIKEQRLTAPLKPAAERVPVAARDEAEVIGMCVALAQPAETIRLFQTSPGRPEEAAAFQPLIAALGPCTSEGQTARFNKPGLRATLALAYRRLALADRGMPGA